MLVSIITRTKNRPKLLPRVVISLANQNYRDFEWVIVNDGGRPELVEDVVNYARTQFDNQIKVIHNANSKGMEAASNAGIRESRGDLLLIHDDDDSLETRFLDKTVKFLQSNPQYYGVVTQANKVIESIEDDGIRLVSTSPLNPWLRSIDLAIMATRNQFPPISFVFKRSAYELVGGFDESLPVLGDWDFNLRLLLLGDVGVVPIPLANHHHRYVDNNKFVSYQNTVTTGIAQHHEWEAIYRNHRLRSDLKEGQFGIGLLLAIGKQNQQTHSELEQLRVAGDAWRSIMSFSKKIGFSWLFSKLSGNKRR